SSSAFFTSWPVGGGRSRSRSIISIIARGQKVDQVTFFLSGGGSVQLWLFHAAESHQVELLIAGDVGAHRVAALPRAEGHHEGRGGVGRRPGDLGVEDGAAVRHPLQLGAGGGRKELNLDLLLPQHLHEGLQVEVGDGEGPLRVCFSSGINHRCVLLQVGDKVGKERGNALLADAKGAGHLGDVHAAEHPAAAADDLVEYLDMAIQGDKVRRPLGEKVQIAALADGAAMRQLLDVKALRQLEEGPTKTNQKSYVNIKKVIKRSSAQLLNIRPVSVVLRQEGEGHLLNAHAPPQTELRGVGRRKERLADLRAQLLRHLLVGGVLDAVARHHRPVLQAGQVLQLGQGGRRVHQLQGALGVVEQAGHHRLVLRGVQTAGAVRHQAVLCEQLQAAPGNLRLHVVEVVRIGGVPLGPDVVVLAEGAVAGARDVGEDAVELERRFGGCLVEGGHRRGVVVGDHHAGAVQPVRLVDQHVAALVVEVVGHYEAIQGLVTTVALLGQDRHAVSVDDKVHAGVGVQHLDDLRRLGAGRGAHVQHRVTGPDLKQQRRDHRHRLLTADVSLHWKMK
ncbi:hypothetical protein TYRP_006817, partial [Tyrophagus putrescentiae]